MTMNSESIHFHRKKLKTRNINFICIHVCFKISFFYSVIEYQKVILFVLQKRHPVCPSKTSSCMSLKNVILFVPQKRHPICPSKRPSCLCSKTSSHLSLKKSSCLSLKNVILFVPQKRHLVCPSTVKLFYPSKTSHCLSMYPSTINVCPPKGHNNYSENFTLKKIPQ